MAQTGASLGADLPQKPRRNQASQALGDPVGAGAQIAIDNLMRKLRTANLATAMCCALVLGVACGGKLAQGNALADDAGTASGGITGASSSVAVTSYGTGGSAGVVTGGTVGALTGGTAGAERLTGGNYGLGGTSPNLGTMTTSIDGTGIGGTGVGGSAGDAGVLPCRASPSTIGCASTYGAALSPRICVVENTDHPRVANCGNLLIFESGHDGYNTTCIYDASTNDLLGGYQWSVSSICRSIYGAVPLLDACANLSLTPCTVDAGSN